MALKEGKMLGFNNREFIVYENEVLGARTVLVLVHGMQEHAKRYKEFSEKLASCGIAFFASDLRGHGKNITSIPGLDEGNIYTNIVEDQKIFINNLRQKYSGAKIVLMGHSYGSFIVQRFVRDYEGLVDKIILCGSSYMNTLLIKVAKVIAYINRVLTGRKAKAKLIEALSIKGYGKGFSGGNWLTRDEKVWKAYQEDPLCGGTFPVAFYQSMFKEVTKNYKGLKKWNAVPDKKVPILLISGDDDPVGERGKGVKRLFNKYNNADLLVEMKLYKGARHELLNEINKAEVISDILEFIRK